MKKIGILNPELSKVIAELGHGDALVVCDAGLPIPPGVQRIDLALSRNVPTFSQVLLAVLEEMKVERATIATEISAKNPDTEAFIRAALGDGVEPGVVNHEEFKRLTRGAKAIVRTGECTPYANVILYSGVVF